MVTFFKAASKALRVT